MEDTTPSPKAAGETPEGTGGVAAAGGGDPLAELDTILADVAQRDRQAAEDSAHEHDAERQFAADFKRICQQEVRPAMEAVLERLRRNGGGGVIESHEGGEARVRTPRLMLWMSLEGDIVGEPRYDRHPYLQLDAEVAKREVEVSEGTMWQGARKGHSGRIGGWQLSEITGERITRKLLDVARHSAT